MVNVSIAVFNGNKDGEGGRIIIANILDLIAKTTVACSIIACGGAEDEQQTPPKPRTIYEIFGEIGLKDVTYAPYKDEQTAEYARDKQALEKKIERLGAEAKTLEDDIKSLKNDNEILKNENKDLRSEINDKEKNNSDESKNNDTKTSEDVKENNVTQSDKDDKGDTTKSDPTSESITELGSFEATYYGMDCAGCTGITASGLDVSGGQTAYNGMTILAADTSVLPLHTKVRITNPDGSSYVGIVKDRGGAIKGRRLDVLVRSESESSGYGRHNVTVEVIEYGDNSYRRE